MKRGLIFFALIFGMLILSTLAQASYTYYNSSIVKNYASGETIRGNVTIKFQKENADSILKSNFVGNISLINFLKENDLFQGEDFNCSTVSCGTDYISDEKITQIGLNNTEKIIGLKLSGEDFGEINDFKMRIKSEAASSCSQQLKVDFPLDSSNISYTNKNYEDIKCSLQNYGCFDLGASSYTQAVIGNDRLCEKITLPAGPAYRLGARVQNTTNVSGDLYMELYNLEQDLLGKSKLPKHAQSIEELSTIVNYSSPNPGEYLVCITGQIGTDYKVNRETVGQNCGKNLDSEQFNRDYEIFAYSLKFGSLDLKINGNDEFEDGNTLIESIGNYVADHYDGTCNPECIIPIKLNGIAQTATFSEVTLNYEDGGDSLSSNFIYSTQKNKSTITSNNLTLDLSLANFTIPSGANNKSKFQLFLGSSKIFETNLSVQSSFDFNITPTFALVGIPTKFQALTSKNITSSTWNFGEGNTVSSTGKNMSYTYTDSGSFSIRVTLTDKSGVQSSKVFTVVSGNPEESVNLTIKDYSNRIAAVKTDLGKVPSWIKEKIEEVIVISDLESELTNIKQDFALASTDEEYVEVLDSLSAMNVPLKVYVSENGSLPLESALDSINTEHLEEISVGGNTESLEERVGYWIKQNYDVNVDFDTYSIFYQDGVEEVVTSFEFNIENIGENEDASYLFFDFPMDSLIFKEDYGQKSLAGGAAAYIPLSSNNQIIDVALPGKIDFSEVGAYISPEMKFLPAIVIDDGEVRESKEGEVVFDSKKFIIGIIILVIVFIIVYIVLQEWYKRNYESRLFKNKDSLYNLLSFIYNSRVTGLRDSEIRKKLQANGWKGEQLNYAFRKIDGRRTGMFEIPIFKFAENRKVKEEIQRRLPAGRYVDARFIKQPRF